MGNLGKGKTFGFGGIQAALRGRGTNSKTISKATQKKTTTSTVRRVKKRKENYNYFIFKVLRQIHTDPQIGISNRAMDIMNCMVTDIFDRVASEASRLSTYTKAMTLSIRDVQTAARLILPGELGKHAVSEGTKAVTKYINNRPVRMREQ